ncbi:MAG: MTH1187 family thiamine-binding protein [Bacteroidales bacterium]|nr:MTH1187 family thiamine-binding protein [Bacteroidales bacterium]MDY0253594.1 MTH1187 family thiamine-binding protein [Tenuifilaceae bacterium]
MFPTRKSTSISPYVSRIVKSVRSKGYQSQLTAMGTIVETNTLKEALAVIEDAYKELENDCDRVYVTLNLDIRKGELGRIEAKVQSVEEKISKSEEIK